MTELCHPLHNFAILCLSLPSELCKVPSNRKLKIGNRSCTQNGDLLAFAWHSQWWQRITSQCITTLPDQCGNASAKPAAQICLTVLHSIAWHRMVCIPYNLEHKDDQRCPRYPLWTSLDIFGLDSLKLAPHWRPAAWKPVEGSQWSMRWIALRPKIDGWADATKWTAVSGANHQHNNVLTGGKSRLNISWGQQERRSTSPIGKGNYHLPEDYRSTTNNQKDPNAGSLGKYCFVKNQRDYFPF